MVTADYEVCFPDGTKSYNETKTIKCSNYPSVVCYSLLGTNYVSISDAKRNRYGQKTTEELVHFKSSVYPIRLNNYSVVKLK